MCTWARGVGLGSAPKQGIKSFNADAIVQKAISAYICTAIAISALVKLILALGIPLFVGRLCKSYDIHMFII